MEHYDPPVAGSDPATCVEGLKREHGIGCDRQTADHRTTSGLTSDLAGHLGGGPAVAFLQLFQRFELSD